MNKIDCLKCREFTETRDVKQKTTKNNRQMLQGICVACGTKKSKFISASGKGFINDAINSLPFEMHMPVHNFTGPGTKLNKCLNEDMTSKAWSKPINRVDKAAYHHDICYVKNNDTKTRNEKCDRKILEELNGYLQPHTSRKAGEGRCFYDYRNEKALRMGVKKNERSESVNWSSQLADELHKPIIKNFPKRKVYVNGIDQIWAADLVEMQAFSKSNHGARYLLTVIDVF